LKFINFLFGFRALELAVKHQKYIEIVIGVRQKYLEEYEKEEKNKLFLKYKKEVSFYISNTT
jgi:hypothetical protein